MKKIYLMLMLVGICLFSVGTAYADVQYLGKVCLALTKGSNGETQTMQLEILSYGTDTFPIHGKIRIPFGSGFISEPLLGTGLLDGNTLLLDGNTFQMSLNASDTTGKLNSRTSTNSVSFDLSTLTGSFGLVTAEASPFMTPYPSLSSFAGTVALQTCP